MTLLEVDAGQLIRELAELAVSLGLLSPGGAFLAWAVAALVVAVLRRGKPPPEEPARGRAIPEGGFDLAEPWRLDPPKDQGGDAP